MAGILAGFFGTEEAGLEIIRPVRELGSIVIDTMSPVSYCAMQQQLDASFPEGLRNYRKSAYLKGLSYELIELLIDGMNRSPSPLNHVILESYGGAISWVPGDTAAFAHRDAVYNLLILALSTDAALDHERISWARSLWERILPHSTGGAYVNYLVAGEDLHVAYSDARLERLAAIKARYDPDNLFCFNHNIRPESPGKKH